ncbi:hypothetical protein EJB05_15508, partial [Eragrostis curvula]
MADIAFSGVEKIVKIALAIQEAVETVKQNNEECRAMERCATRCSALFKRLEEKTDTMKDEVMRAPLEDVAESLEEALKLVKLCQQKHYSSHLLKAADMAKELRRVQDDIVRKVNVGDFATKTQATVRVTDIQNARAPPPPPQPLPPPPSEEVAPAGFTRFSLYDLRTATKDFSDENIIGKGGFSTVYKGVLQGGQEVAIKKRPILYGYDESLYDGINSFLKLKHKNIIRALGYCHEITSMSELKATHFVSLKNICHWDLWKTFSKAWSRLIDWSYCFRIIQGIAQGVHYLHEQRVVHVDLKPDNIVLGYDTNPRISNFGLATKLEHVDAEITVSDSLFGTP